MSLIADACWAPDEEPIDADQILSLARSASTARLMLVRIAAIVGEEAENVVDNRGVVAMRNETKAQAKLDAEDALNRLSRSIAQAVDIAKTLKGSDVEAQAELLDALMVHG